MNANTMTHAPARWSASKRRLVATLNRVQGLYPPVASNDCHDTQHHFFGCRP